MAVDLERLVVSLEANLKQYERELARANRTTVTQLRALERQATVSATRIERSFTGIGTGVKAALAGLGVGSVTLAFVKLQRAISDVADIGDLADKIGITAEKLQELNFGAVQANMSLEELGSAMLFFSRQIGEASRGEGNLVEILKANNIALRDASGNLRPINDLFRDYANVVANAANQQEALVFITKAFGRASDEMLEFLAKGSGGLDGFAEAARNAGAVIDNELVKRAQVFDDAWAAAMLAAKANMASFALSVIDHASDIGSALAAIGNSSFFKKLNEFLGVDPAAAQAAFDAATGQRQMPTGGPGTFPVPSGRAQPAASVLPRDVDKDTAAIERNTEAKRNQKIWTDFVADSDRAWIDSIEDSTRALQQQNEQIKSMAAGALSDFLGDLTRGASAADAFKSALDRLTQSFIDMWAEILARQAVGFFTKAFAGGGFSAGTFHQGGVVGQNGPKREVSPLAFLGAQRMHSGGLAGDEVAAILQKGERVLPRGAKAGGNLSVVVNNHTGQPVQQRETRQGNGDRQLEIVVGRMIGDGRFDGSMRARFGTPPSPRTR